LRFIRAGPVVNPLGSTFMRARACLEPPAQPGEPWKLPGNSRPWASIPTGLRGPARHAHRVKTRLCATPTYWRPPGSVRQPARSGLPGYLRFIVRQLQRPARWIGHLWRQESSATRTPSRRSACPGQEGRCRRDRHGPPGDTDQRIAMRGYNARCRHDQRAERGICTRPSRVTRQRPVRLTAL
jgi:hypothetical protein